MFMISFKFRLLRITIILDDLIELRKVGNHDFIVLSACHI